MESMDYLAFFRMHVPTDFLRKLVGTIFDCYADADDQCRALFDEPERLNTIPFHRRGLIEQAMRRIAKDADGVTASVEKGESWWRYTLISCGPVAFTENAAGGPAELVRPSNFRQQYCVRNRQLMLFEMDDSIANESTTPLSPIQLYGILLHGHSDRPELPGFVVIRFPNQDYSGYLPGCIDLMLEFPEVVAGRHSQVRYDPSVVEKVEEPMPKLQVRKDLRGRGA